MRVAVLGARGSVGKAVTRALLSAEHSAISLSSTPTTEYLAISELGRLLQDSAIDIVVNAAGPGDHRARPDWQESSRLAAAAVARFDVPKIVLSTVRVFEACSTDFFDDTEPMPGSHYAEANLLHEAVWLDMAGERCSILRLANFLTVPEQPSPGGNGPQEALLPWSLAREAYETGAIVVRSPADRVKAYVSAEDVAAALGLMASCSAPTHVTCAPGALFSLGQLVDAVGDAFEARGRSRPRATFGTEGGQGPLPQGGWLSGQGWSSGVTHDTLVALVTEWLAGQGEQPTAS